MNVFIKNIEVYLPGEAISNHHLAEKVSLEGTPIPADLLKKTMGSKFRYHAKKEEQVSDLAVQAAKKLLSQYKSTIDLLIFASASADLIEPATCNIVHQKLNLTCPAFDVKNACNSVLSALEIGGSLLKTSPIKNVLIVSGEKPSDSITYSLSSSAEMRERFAAFSFGDAGMAILLEKTDEDKGFIFQKSRTFGEHWPLCTIKGGGSMFPKDASQLIFTGHTYQLKSVFNDITKPFLQECLSESGVKLEDISYICTHQVSASMYEDMSKYLNFPLDRFIPLFEEFGNTASISVPLAYHHLTTSKDLKHGDHIMLLGLAAGVNISIQILKV